jgi:hypothetical protein
VPDIFVLLDSDTILLVAEKKKGSCKANVRYFGPALPDGSAPVKTDPQVCGWIYVEETLVNLENKVVLRFVISFPQHILDRKL